nr:MAG TPA: xyloglucan endo-transglycosylase [Caudoviricetes sp.]
MSSINLNYWVYRIYRLYPRALKYMVYDFCTVDIYYILFTP